MRRLLEVHARGVITAASLLVISTAGSSASGQQGDTPKSAAPPARSVEERLDRIEQILQQLVGERGAGAPRARPTTPFRRPADLAGRALNSTRGDADAEGVDRDRDRDGLTDDEETRLGTNPGNPDSDGDALLDGWEVFGVNGIDLPSMGASPLHRDIFVEMDFMTRDSATNELGPNDSVLRGIEAIFRDAPVRNPDGTTGIAIHLERGQTRFPTTPTSSLTGPSSPASRAITSRRPARRSSTT